MPINSVSSGNLRDVRNSPFCSMLANVIRSILSVLGAGFTASDWAAGLSGANAPTRKAKAKKPAPIPEDLPLTQFQKFEYREVPRKLLQNAPYNPNVMNDYNFKLLERKMKQVGLLTTIVWNEETGNIVGGHHRLRSLDRIEGTADYTVGVAVVRMTRQREKEMNIFLNNARVQGAFDQEKFFKLLSEDQLDLAELGLTKLDLEMEFGALPQSLGKSMMAEHDSILEELEAEASAYHPDDPKQQTDKAPANGEDGSAPNEREAESTPQPDPKAVSPEEQKAAMKAARRAFHAEQANKPENDRDYYVVLVFDHAEQKQDFLRRRDLPLDSPYLTAYDAGFITNGNS